MHILFVGWNLTIKQAGKQSYDYLKGKISFYQECRKMFEIEFVLLPVMAQSPALQSLTTYTYKMVFKELMKETSLQQHTKI